MGIKAIETVYNGYRFRSRLEARWAVFFDTLGIKYEYELEGFDLGSAGWYLPDFWLPQVKMWAEVKPFEFSEVEKEKCRQLALQSGFSVLMLDGPPHQRNYWAFEPEDPECPPLCDYVLFEGDRWKDEGRFYSSTGARDWEICDESQLGGEEAVNAARQARFEHGVSG